jgi:hypothetical protein
MNFTSRELKVRKIETFQAARDYLGSLPDDKMTGSKTAGMT